jgi:hypothetical protein
MAAGIGHEIVGVTGPVVDVLLLPEEQPQIANTVDRKTTFM